MKAGVGVLSLAAAAMLVFLGMALAEPTASSRGSDELVYAMFGQLPFDAPGTGYDQPVELQVEGVSRLSIPYHLDGPRAALVHVSVREPGGPVLLDEVRSLDATVQPLTTYFLLGSSYWDSQQSGWVRLDVRSRNHPSELQVHFDRLDANGGGFFFYTDPAVATDKPPLAENHDIAIVVQTSYGPLRQAFLKAPVYAARVNSLAPPWLPGVVPELLLVLMLLAGLATVVLCLKDGSVASSKLVDRNDDL